MLPAVWSATDITVILGHFLPFYSLLTPKFKSWEKCKQNPGYIILLHLSDINEDHTMYGSWDMRHDGQSFWSFWAIFCPLTLLTTWKSKFSKNEKNPGDIIILHLFTTNDNHMMYDFWDTVRGRPNFFLVWTIIFCTHCQPEKSKFQKNEKKKQKQKNKTKQ